MHGGREGGVGGAQLRVQSVLTSDCCNNVGWAEVAARGQRAEVRSSFSPRTKPDGSDF